MLFALHLKVPAATFYISSSQGNDAASGRSEQAPWRTINHIINVWGDTIHAGDVVQLKRGDFFSKYQEEREAEEWTHWVMQTAAPITIAAYGDPSEPRPVVSGGVPIANWEVHQGNIWVADAPDTLSMLYVNEEPMLFARYPNSGWLWRDDTDNDDVFICDELRSHPRNADDYWVGANTRWRNHNWWWGGKKRITDYDAAAGQIVCEGDAMPGETMGFYIDKKLQELDTAGEWHFDAENMKVYLYAPGGIDPNTARVYGSIYRRTGMRLQTEGLRVEDLCFRYFDCERAVAVNHRTQITRCLFECIGSDNARNVINCYKSEASGSRITHSKFRNITCVAIGWGNDTAAGTPQTLFEFDTLTDVMTIPAYGGQWSQNWSNTAMLIKGRNVMVRHCYFKHNAYSGLLGAGDHDTIEYNIFDDCMSTLNDGAAIYTYCNNTVIRNNLVLNTRGCCTECGMSSHGPGYQSVAHGIWPEFLQDFHGMVIENNTVAHSGAHGIFLRDNFDAIVRNNVSYDNGGPQLSLSQKKENRSTGRTDFVPANHLIEGNVLVCSSPERQHAVSTATGHASDATGEERLLQQTYDLDFGVIRNNYYCNPTTDTLVWRKYVGRMTLADWQANLTCADPTPRTDPIKRPANAAEGDPTGTTRLVINDQLTRRTIPLDNGVYLTKDADTVIGAVTLDPYTSVVLWHTGRTSAHPYRAPIAEFTAFRAASGGRLSLHTSLNKRASMRIRVYALSGRLVSEKTYALQAGAHDLPIIDAQGTTACGFYHCEATISTEHSCQDVRTKTMVIR